MSQSITADIIGSFLEPLTEYLDDDSVSEILVNGAEVYIERRGVLTKTGVEFKGKILTAAIRSIARAVQKEVDADNPRLDARLADGSRIAAVLPPVAVTGPYLAVRKFGRRRMTIEDLVREGSISEKALAYLREEIQKRKTVLISGGTSTGKTTLLNCLADMIDPTERIIVVEDTSELQLRQPHVLRLEANKELGSKVTIRDLVHSCLRLRPDRIVVGEVRGVEAFDFLQALNTGHEGSFCTVHANSARLSLSRLEGMTLLAAENLNLNFIRREIATAINAVVQIRRGRDGRRYVDEIAEVRGLQGDEYQLEAVPI